jgi:hypothetical protein
MRTVARTAVVAGTATVVAGGVRRHQESKAEQAQAAAQPQAQVAAAPAAEGAPIPGSSEAIEQLKEMAQLHDQGILTDEEFADQKAKLLG